MPRRHAIALLLLVLAAGPAGCAFLKMVRHGDSSVDDYRIFPARRLHASRSPIPFRERGAPASGPAVLDLTDREREELSRFLAAHDTLAFLVVRGNTLLYEGYFNGHARDDPSFCFSMTKSFLSLLIGCAIDDGLIRSVDQPVTDFVPELAPNGFGRVTLKHLLQMTSGMAYRDSDSPFSLHPYFYYGDNLEERLLRLRLDTEPGTAFRYKSGESQLLGLVLKRALKGKPVTAYMQERVWEPLGMEHDGLWSIDHEGGDGLEKTFCCLAATARDVAKIGRLYLNEGRADGVQVVSPAWVRDSTRVDTSQGSVANYQYQWWIPFEGHPAFMASGYRGQYLYVNPDLGLVIVRLGPSRGGLEHDDWLAFMRSLESSVGARGAGP